LIGALSIKNAGFFIGFTVTIETVALTMNLVMELFMGLLTADLVKFTGELIPSGDFMRFYGILW